MKDEHKTIIQRMCSTTLFAFSKGNRLIKERMNIIKTYMLRRNSRISPDCISKIETRDISTVVGSEASIRRALFIYLKRFILDRWHLF